MPTGGSAAALRTGERQRIVWWAHVARGSAAIVVLFARFMYEFREQKTLVKAFTFTSPIPLSELPTTFAYSVYVWPRDHIDVDPGTYEPLPVYKPAATRAQIDRALDMLDRAERPLIVAGGGIINADAADLLVAAKPLPNSSRALFKSALS